MRRELDEWGGVIFSGVQSDCGNAERYLAPILHEHPDSTLPVTKTWGQSQKAVFASMRESAYRLEVEYLNAELLDDITTFDLECLLAEDGAHTGLGNGQDAELVRYLGLRGHMEIERFAAALDSGEFDISMPVVGFVDRHS